MTEAQVRLSRKFFIYRTLTNFWFLSSTWLYFYRLYVTDAQVGVLDGFAFAIGLIAEVPSGALADRFGRDKMVRIGQFLSAAGFLIQAFGSSFVPFFLGQAILMIGVSFVSGADEALFFENLGFERESPHWRKLLIRGSQFSLAASLVGTLIGGWLYSVDPSIPWILTGLGFLASVTVVWSVKDTRIRSKSLSFAHEVAEHVRSIKVGFAEFLTPKLWLYVPIIVSVQGLFYTAGWGILKLILLDRFYFNPFQSSLVLASSSIITIGLFSYLHRNTEAASEKRVLTVIGFAAVAGLLLSVADIGMWGYFVILALAVGERILYPFMSDILNKHAEESQRATVLSVASFLRTLPYVVLAPIIGYLSTHNQLPYFLVTWAIVMAASITLYLALGKQYAKVAL
jgi:MFS family permease